MAKKWELLKQEIEAETARIWLEEPDEMKIQRMGLLCNQAGSYGQYFGTWEFANGMMRDLSMYTMYPMFRLMKKGTYSLEQMKDLYCGIVPVYTEYLRYSGYPTLSRFCRGFRDCMDETGTEEEFLAVYKTLLMYCNKLAAWVYHYAPWEMAVVFRQKDDKWVNEAKRLLDIQKTDKGFLSR